MDKEWYKSKTIWTSVASLIVAVTVAMGYEIPPEMITTLLFAFAGLIGINLRASIKK